MLLRHLHPHRHALRQLGDVGDHADHPLPAVQGLDALHDHVEGLAVQASKTFVEEQTLQTVLGFAFGAERCQAPAKGERQRGEERFAAQQNRRSEALPTAGITCLSYRRSFNSSTKSSSEYP